MQNIGLIGKARSGKDTAAAHLVASRSYTRLAFADPLKEMALRVDPFVFSRPYFEGLDTDDVRLSEVVEDFGWERAKDRFPEVRRLLQHMGQTVREYDEDFWLRILLDKVKGASLWNMPVVVTDVRYRNEALSLRRAGFKLVRIVRPEPTALPLTGASAIPARRLSDQATQHASETELDTFAADLDILNSGSIETLHAMISAA